MDVIYRGDWVRRTQSLGGAASYRVPAPEVEKVIEDGRKELKSSRNDGRGPLFPARQQDPEPAKQ
jgi:hypothetical protein